MDTFIFITTIIICIIAIVTLIRRNNNVSLVNSVKTLNDVRSKPSTKTAIVLIGRHGDQILVYFNEEKKSWDIPSIALPVIYSELEVVRLYMKTMFGIAIEHFMLPFAFSDDGTDIFRNHYYIVFKVVDPDGATLMIKNDIKHRFVSFSECEELTKSDLFVKYINAQTRLQLKSEG